MIERRRGLRLLAKSRYAVGIARELGRQDFDRDVTVKPRITCTIHFPHPTGAGRRNYFVRTDLSAIPQTHGAIIRGVIANTSWDRPGMSDGGYIQGRQFW